MFRKTILSAFLLLSAGVLFGAQAKYIFLLIGDGLAAPQRAAAEAFFQSATGREDAVLAMNDMPVKGFATTHSANAKVTDSAAAGTALACGRKTANGVLGMDESKREKLDSIAKFAHRKGMAVGIISSVPVDHATPAAFYASQENRSQSYEIACQLSESGFEYFAGAAAGEKKVPEGKLSPSALAVEAGYRLAETREDILALRVDGSKTWVWDNRYGSLRYAIDQKDGDSSLVDFSAKGIELLRNNPAGFFMMIEGGRIDWACHANDAAACVAETLDFDKVVALALAFYREYPEETLLVVTGDHETGGMAFDQEKGNVTALAGQQGSFESFDWMVGKMIGEGGGELELLAAATEFFGLKDMSDSERGKLLTACRVQLSGNDSEARSMYGKYKPISLSATQIISGRAGISWQTHNHSAMPVLTTAIGVGAETFTGNYDNTDIAKKILAVMPGE